MPAVTIAQPAQVAEEAQVEENQCTTLFRAVSRGELVDIANNGILRPAEGQMSGKWFTGSLDDATSFGRAFFDRGWSSDFHVVSTIVPNDLLNEFHFQPGLDGIADSWYVSSEQLPSLNGQITWYDNLPIRK